MNLPNKLTLLRVLLIPFFVVSLLYNTPISRYIALIIFIVASFTDTLDGYIARKYNLVTNFGKFMDPLADKLLVCSALICLSYLNYLNVYVVLIVIAREFIISGFRIVAADARIVIAASKLGKAKTVTQMITVILLMLNLDVFYYVTEVCIYLTVIFTIVSLVEYIYKNKNVILDSSI